MINQQASKFFFNLKLTRNKKLHVCVDVRVHVTRLRPNCVPTVLVSLLFRGGGRKASGN